MKPKPTPKPDHGTFTIPAQADEAAMLWELTERAAKNKDKPGQGWARVTAHAVRGGRRVEGHRVYHLDLHTRVLEITEVWDGVETARETRAMAPEN